MFAAFPRAWSAFNLWETHACNTKKNPRVAEEADYSQFPVVLNFPFVFQYTHMLVFFYTDAIKINRKSIPWNRKPLCVLREKDRQVIKTTSNLVFKLIIALIWKIRSPSQFSKCRNSHVKTINIATINAITMVSGLRTSSEGEIMKSPRNFHVPKVPTTTRFYATCIHELKVYVFCRFYLVGKLGPKKCGSKPQLLIQCTGEIIWNFF